MKKNSRLLQLKQRLRPRWVKTLRQLVSSRLKLGRVTRRFGLKPVNGNPLKAIKTSDTLFILGSGGSINTLTEDDWQRIRAADSIGFNFWPLHDHIPTLYVREVYGVPAGDEDIYQCYFELMLNRTEAYLSTPILIKDGERVSYSELTEFISNFPMDLHRNIALAWDWEIPGNDQLTFTNKIKTWEKYRLITSERMPLVRKTASIAYLVLLGLRAGYRDIVLCGVDLNNNAYFYQLSEKELQSKGRPVPRVPQSINEPVHKTDNPNSSNLPISQVLDIINRELLQPRHIRLWVAQQSSKLYPMLPCYFGH